MCYEALAFARCTSHRVGFVVAVVVASFELVLELVRRDVRRPSTVRRCRLCLCYLVAYVGMNARLLFNDIFFSSTPYPVPAFSYTPLAHKHNRAARNNKRFIYTCALYKSSRPNNNNDTTVALSVHHIHTRNSARGVPSSVVFFLLCAR